MTIYGGVYRGDRFHPNANPILATMREDDLKGDPWGTAMAWAFACCEYLHHVALTDVPAELDYRPAAVARGEGYEEEGFAEQVLVELAVDTFTVTTAARVLSRYLDWCKAAGRDY
jgi:hypothetical protein